MHKTPRSVAGFSFQPEDTPGLAGNGGDASAGGCASCSACASSDRKYCRLCGRSISTRGSSARSRKATDAAFAKAAHVVTLDIENQRVVALSLEARAVLAWVAEDGRLTLRMSTQMPSGVRTTLSGLLGLAPEQVRVTVATSAAASA